MEQSEDRIETKEGGGLSLVEIEPGIRGYVGEHVESGSKGYENLSNFGYWIVTSSA